MLYFCRVLSSKLTRVSVAANVDHTEPPSSAPLPELSVTVGMQGEDEREGGRERKGGGGGGRERIMTHHCTYFFCHRNACQRLPWSANHETTTADTHI